MKKNIKSYRVVIPYYHEFIVWEKNKRNAIKSCIYQGNGIIIGRDDEHIEVERLVGGTHESKNNKK